MAKKRRVNAAEKRAQAQAKRKNLGKAASAKNRQKQMKEQGEKITVTAMPQKPTEHLVRTVPKKKWIKEDNIQPLQVKYQKAASVQEINFAEPVTVRVQLLSPIHLGSGQADVNVDAEVIHDDVGLPYFPAKRFKGLLYESALEVAEMAELSGLPLFRQQDLDVLFQHGSTSEQQFIVSNLYLPDYEQMHQDWQQLEQNFPTLFQAGDVLAQYTSLRYQTKIDAETGTAADTSLHNMRVIEEGLTFTGTLSIQNGNQQAFTILALALRNLSQAGLKRTRGFGHIACTMEQDGKDIMLPLVKQALAAGQEGGAA